MLDSSKRYLEFTMQRHPFPVKIVLPITLNEAQMQIFELIGADLRISVFMHGMLYVVFFTSQR